MAEQELQKGKSKSALSPEKSGSSVFRKSLKAASSILKSVTLLSAKKSQSSNFLSGSQSAQSIQKSVSSVASEKFSSKDSVNVKKKESQLSAKEINSKNVIDDQEKERTISIEDIKSGKGSKSRKRVTKFMRKYPELFRDDVSINPSYTKLRNFPYNVVCRQRFHKNKLNIYRQLNKEIENITMMQTLALDGVRVGRIFSVGFNPSQLVLRDFATPAERQRLNEILRDR